ncbi:MAG: metal-dependent transcriptional regulator [Armatimonadota bacterium]|nr:metal-dependent transcriptional regulator [Armatimonadota bacterium]MDR7402156.1 metal-dependent transcriptional regulator [Armatimonadota bacterium]MDR7404675.1 metal-dependent transcriptional regulator [Armatimonadota bacterium]MDR7436913.1 metal-dependent transcriptional regulator [Armatimonadota bacterium]MDR7472313.1 metal-dependent transcriptional regulator [Armatimonadota bacterium]
MMGRAVVTGRAVEDYLKVLYALTEPGGGATVGQIAERLGVSPPSVTNMIKRLARQGLVRHDPYRAVYLTDAGRAAAEAVVRRHRLLELYLSRALGIDPSQVHDEADRLEHALSESLERRLDELLGHPDTDPHGEPIPRG